MLAASIGEINGDQSVQVFSMADLTPGIAPTDRELQPGQRNAGRFVFRPAGAT
jgi:hypothetical protein